MDTCFLFSWVYKDSRSEARPGSPLLLLRAGTPWVRQEVFNGTDRTSVLGNASDWLPLVAEINRRDYRAWYGLGQIYEILKMYFYSLYYFRQAQVLR